MTRVAGFLLLGAALWLALPGTAQEGTRPLRPLEEEPTGPQLKPLEGEPEGLNPAPKGETAGKPAATKKVEIKPLGGEAGKDGQAQPLSAGGENPREIMARVAKNMEASDDRLHKKDTGTDTRQIQARIIEDLDKLIKQAQDQQDRQNQSSSSCACEKESSNSSSQGQNQQQSGSSSQQKQGNQQQSQPKGQKNQDQSQQARKDDQAGQKPQTNKAGQRPDGQEKKDDQAGQQEQKAGEQSAKAGEQDGKQDQGKQDQGKQKSDGNKAGDGGDSDAPESTVADLFRDVWGHLPKTRRMEMDAYSRMRFMSRYDSLLRQYYRSIAERARKEGD